MFAMVKQLVQERRNWVRAKRVLSIEFRRVSKNKSYIDDAWHLSTTQDMSIGGVSFYTDCEYRKNDILEIRIVMSGILDIFKGFGKVVRVEKRKTGAYYLIAIALIHKDTKKVRIKAKRKKKRI